MLYEIVQILMLDVWCGFGVGDCLEFKFSLKNLLSLDVVNYRHN